MAPQHFDQKDADQLFDDMNRAGIRSLEPALVFVKVLGQPETFGLPEKPRNQATLEKRRANQAEDMGQIQHRFRNHTQDTGIQLLRGERNVRCRKLLTSLEAAGFKFSGQAFFQQVEGKKQPVVTFIFTKEGGNECELPAGFVKMLAEAKFAELDVWRNAQIDGQEGAVDTVNLKQPADTAKPGCQLILADNQYELQPIE